VEGLAAAGDLGGAGFASPDRQAVEIGQRHEAGGVPAGIEAFAVRRAVGVDRVAVEGGAHRGGAGQEAVVEPLDVPVGVGEHPAAVVQVGADVLGQEGAGVRQAEHHRPVAAGDLDGGHAREFREGRAGGGEERAGAHEGRGGFEIGGEVAVLGERRHLGAQAGHGRWQRRGW
jgi:hypothetical protein